MTREFYEFVNKFEHHQSNDNQLIITYETGYKETYIGSIDLKQSEYTYDEYTFNVGKIDDKGWHGKYWVRADFKEGKANGKKISRFEFVSGTTSELYTFYFRSINRKKEEVFDARN